MGSKTNLREFNQQFTVVSASGGQGNCEKCNCPAYKTGLCDFGICVEFTSRDVITTKVTIVSV